MDFYYASGHSEIMRSSDGTVIEGSETWRVRKDSRNKGTEMDETLFLTCMYLESTVEMRKIKCFQRLYVINRVTETAACRICKK